MNVTTHLIVSFSVFRRHKCYASCNNMFYVFFCLIGYPACTINWSLHDVLLMITCIGCFILGCCYLLLSICLFRPQLHTTPRIFPLSTDGLSRSRQNCPCNGCLLNSSLFLFSMLDLCWFLIFWAAVFHVIHFCFTRLASFCTEYLVFLAPYSCTNLVSLCHFTCWDQQQQHYMLTPVPLINVHHFSFWCRVY